ncbi:major histocompatibility complex class I-related gene protein-like [Chanos chanos]|uniref:Major histocompatibility complex class I-related gene protein-like n=1 Tax=Chanos chanos TaxID=29144 RepID=A0A6J2WNI5_CHACN|nr:major histocompatibility complex class I-related gene protein-like [Chanos chanos]
MAPGIYEFSYVGLIDNTEIESYNSENKIKIPEQDWMRERLSEDYWKSGTDRLRDEEKWMRNEFNKMMVVMGHSQSDPDVHILQRRRGCEVERLSDGSVKFLSGSEQYRYDGQDFLSFNLHTEKWEALNDQALSIKQSWNSNIPLKHETLKYIQRTCVNWAEELMKYEDDYIRNYSPPEVHVFSRKSSTPDKLNLTCFATGFLPKEITIKIKRNHVQMHRLKSTGVRPNGDGTHQLRMSVEIPESDRAEYYCSVMHRTLDTPVVTSLGALVVSHKPKTHRLGELETLNCASMGNIRMSKTL